MKKIIEIEGMHCEHCAGSAKASLENIEGVKKVKINLKKGIAVVSLSSFEDEIIFKTKIEEAGFKFVALRDKKGIF